MVLKRLYTGSPLPIHCFLEPRALFLLGGAQKGPSTNHHDRLAILRKKRLTFLEISSVSRAHMRDNVTEQLSWIGVDGTDWAWVIFRLGVEVVAFAVLQGGHLEYDLVVALLIHREILKVRERMWVAALALSKGSILEIAFDIGQLDRSAVFAFVALLE